MIYTENDFMLVSFLRLITIKPMGKPKLFLESSITHRLKVELLIKKHALTCLLLIWNLYLSSIYLEKTEKDISLTYLFDMPII